MGKNNGEVFEKKEKIKCDCICANCPRTTTQGASLSRLIFNLRTTDV
jgi:hypothetical protein